ncbi:hypothetical protein Dda_7653 [Drechslerella dactyloides]|uniref:Uncharacterized protein n=1 Tax=Drechslerella dactyloides TaxID=74499 RepID=A0AAD6ISL3_DREDA|nr:hypothetical protein Dda_7653 [Drechslerella dactyloides]
MPALEFESFGSSSPFEISLVGNAIVVESTSGSRSPSAGQSGLPDPIAAKGGLLIAMHEDEAMWINFELRMQLPVSLDDEFSPRHYGVKIYAGGINVVSGVPENETTASTLRRRNLLGKGKSFVAKPPGKGLTIEGQMTGDETVSGLQFEIITTKRCPAPAVDKRCIHVYVRRYGAKSFILYNVSLELTCGNLIDLIAKNDDVSRRNQVRKRADGSIDLGFVVTYKRRYLRRQLEQPIRSLGVEENDGRMLVVVHEGEVEMNYALGVGSASYTLAGGREKSDQPRDSELGIAAGGHIRQAIVADKLSNDEWDKENILVFNVQLLNAQDYIRITRFSAPPKPVKSIAQLTGQFDNDVQVDSVLIGPGTGGGIIPSAFESGSSKVPAQPGIEASGSGLSSHYHVENAGSAPLGVSENAEKLPAGPAENKNAIRVPVIQAENAVSKQLRVEVETLAGLQQFGLEVSTLTKGLHRSKNTSKAPALLEIK